MRSAAYAEEHLLTPREVKRWRTLAAQAARAGIVVTLIEADDGEPAWILTRWNLTTELRGLDALEARLRHMGAVA